MSLIANALDARRITAALAGHAVGGEVQVHAELPSTSDHARGLGQLGHASGLAVFAEEQTAGRGRRENRWTSQPGLDLACSVLLRPAVRMELWPRLPTLAALAVCRAVGDCAPLQPEIKWPNDVFVQERKCAGILAETFTGGGGAFMVLGIGINVNSQAFPDELRTSATSLKLAGGRTVERNALAIALLHHLDRLLPWWETGFDRAVQEVRARSWLLGRRVTARMDGREMEGTAADLDGEGRLLLREDSGAVLTLGSAEQVRAVAPQRPAS